MKRPEHRPWRVLSSEYVARRPWFTVRRESVELPTGAVVPEWYVFEFPDWVNVIARTREGLFVMISQYRHALGETRYELVAGTCEQGETPLESAQRELLEEAGCSMEDVVKTTVFIKEMNDFGAINEVYAEFFTGDYPARSCVEVARLPKDVMIEMEAIALKK